MALGISSILSVLKLVRTIGVALGHETAKNGVHPRALTAVVEAPGFQEQLKIVMENVRLVPNEAADIDLFESFTLAHESLETVKDIVRAFKAA